jgi:hypothetical protein
MWEPWQTRVRFPAAPLGSDANIGYVYAAFFSTVVPLDGDVSAPDSLGDGSGSPATGDLFDAGAGLLSLD